MPASSAAAIPTREQVEGWDTAHLETARIDWTSTAGQWESQFETIHQGMVRPGGTLWEGAGADAAQDRAWADVVKVRGMADHLHNASAAARHGAGEIAWAKNRALGAISAAEVAGFAVGQDLSVTDRQVMGPSAELAARQAQAQMLAAEIRTAAANLVAVDNAVAGKISSALAPLDHLDSNEGEDKHTVQATTFKEAPAPEPPPPDPNPTPPVRGLPPEGVSPPVEGPLTPGPASRPSEAGKGGQSLWDKHGGEWRYFPGDKWHNPHWDYNGHQNPNSPWDNVPIGGLPPRIADPAPTIADLPPWLLNPSVPGVVGPPQNPLLAPYPGATMPEPGPVPVPAPGPDFMPHINLPTPSPGDLQTAGGQTAIVGGGGLLLLILGAMALA